MGGHVFDIEQDWLYGGVPFRDCVIPELWKASKNGTYAVVTGLEAIHVGAAEVANSPHREFPDLVIPHHTPPYRHSTR